MMFLSMSDLQARLITAANYKDTVEERSIVKLCGYPVCSNKLGKVRICVFLKGFTFLLAFQFMIGQKV